VERRALKEEQVLGAGEEKKLRGGSGMYYIENQSCISMSVTGGATKCEGGGISLCSLSTTLASDIISLMVMPPERVVELCLLGRNGIYHLSSELYSDELRSIGGRHWQCGITRFQQKDMNRQSAVHDEHFDTAVNRC
jgi:hypothetical protein